MNMANLRAVHDQFMAYTTNPSNYELDKVHFSIYYKNGISSDQGALLGFFQNRTDFLPLDYNWKAYWEPRSDHYILHFHGPKPNRYQSLLRTTSSHSHQTRKKVTNVLLSKCYSSSNQGCKESLEIYEKWLNKVT